MSVFGAAAYLACSWTWCIGMWLPVYLIGDFGWPGWVVFAVPNVIGAMSVGLLLSDAAEAGRVIERHRLMISAFSVWTILFHALFAGRMVRTFVGGIVPAEAGLYAPAQVVGLGLALLVVLFAMLPLGRAAIAAIIVWLLSVALGAAAFTLDGGFALAPSAGRFGIGSLALASPVIAMGFLLCPFLDGTLLGVRSALRGSRGTLAFVLGFGVLFLAMIVMTLGYGGKLNRVDFRSFSAFIFPGHVILQTAFTVGVHIRYLATRGAIGAPGGGVDGASRRGGLAGVRGWGALALGGAAFLVFTGSVALRMVGDLRPGYDAWRLAYDLFLGAYALVFPAYALIVMLGRRRLRLGARGAWIGWALAVALGLPCLVMGAVMQEYPWMLGVVGALAIGMVAGKMLSR